MMSDAEVAGSQPPYLYPPYVSSRKRAPTRQLVALPSALRDVAGLEGGAVFVVDDLDAAQIPRHR